MNDDELLRHLADALDPGDEPPEPSPHSMLLLRAVVRGASPATAARRARPPWLRRIAVFGAAVVAVGGGSGVALAATDTPLPTPVRAAARAVGLPVDSAPLAATRDAQQDLKTALQRHDPAAAAAAATVLQHDFNRLGSSDRRQVSYDVTHVLQQAASQDAPVTTGNHEDAGRSSPTSTRPSAPPTSAPDHNQTTAARNAGGGDHGDHGQSDDHRPPNATTTTTTTAPRSDDSGGTSAPSTTQPDHQGDHGSGSGGGQQHGDSAGPPRDGH
jgi:hypothetical protein